MSIMCIGYIYISVVVVKNVFYSGELIERVKLLCVVNILNSFPNNHVRKCFSSVTICFFLLIVINS